MFSRFLIVFFILGGVFYEADTVLKTTFVEDLCFSFKKSTINLRYETSGILMSAPMRNYAEDFVCEVVLLPPSGKSVVLSILRYDVRTNDELTIEDSDRHRFALLGSRDFKDEKKSVVSDGMISIRYRVSNQTTTYRRSGFQFSYTKVGNVPCNSDEFQCKNEKCVLKSFMCDGHNHCGDLSGQAKCSQKIKNHQYPEERITYKHYGPYLIAVVVSGVIIIVLFIVFVVVMVRRRKAEKALQQQSASTQRGGNIPLESVATSVVQHPSAVNNVQQTTAAEQPSLYHRVRRSFRGVIAPKVENVHRHQASPERYEVPAMYPSLHQLPYAPEMNGIENLEFKIEE